MESLLDYIYWLIAMAVLVGLSAFFSCGEAALFYLRNRDRRALREGNPAQRVAAALLEDPDRLLTAVLFWNLAINILYFTISSIVALQLQQDRRQTEAGLFAFGSLLTLIFLSEMFPKTLGVLSPRLVAPLISLPMATAVRMVDPLIPALRTANLLSRRLIWPGFEPEPYLELADLERAIQLSTTDAELQQQEQAILQNIVALSHARIVELMRPRVQFRAFRPPVSREQLGGRMPPSEYLLITEPDSDEIASSVSLKSLAELPRRHLEHLAEPVLYVPWCTTTEAVLEDMIRRDREVAAVVNEFGETIGIVTFDDLLDSLLRTQPSRSSRLTHRSSIEPAGPNAWRVTGMTSLRRIAKHFNVGLPTGRSATVSGVLQETLGRLPQTGDECDWGPIHLRILNAAQFGPLDVELTFLPPAEETP